MSSCRKTWTEEEDEMLKEFVIELGETRWGLIAKMIESRLNKKSKTGKQCRERWHNHINPIISKNSWTTNEKNKILELHDIYGNQWSKIAQHLKGRTDNAVKNFYYSNLRKQSRISAKMKSENRKKTYRTKLRIAKECQKNKDKNDIYEDKSYEDSLEIDAPKILYSMSEPELKIKQWNEEKIHNSRQRTETESILY
ncbi:hypothetical protein SteCoe_7707 [Stentor coeruleus]|uniref:Myb-like DNA-binding domain containing protein n=1 Tax=Stentor coeruleus TaxID=5963 RepID=A0A1R2CLY6_9CILI|nr:hypothetical protein SteCoe_7707 [Stentor coeruleus]